jgi:hypothetical protein
MKKAAHSVKEFAIRTFINYVSFGGEKTYDVMTCYGPWDGMSYVWLLLLNAALTVAVITDGLVAYLFQSDGPLAAWFVPYFAGTILLLAATQVLGWRFCLRYRWLYLPDADEPPFGEAASR